MRRTLDSLPSVLLIAIGVTGLFWQFLLTAFVVVVALGFISGSQEAESGYEGLNETTGAMDCLSDIKGVDSVESKLHALSCLGLHTSYSAWANQSDSLADCIAGSTPGSQPVANEVACAWLKPGNWRCSMLPFVKAKTLLAACRRHDLNYTTLQTLGGNGDSDKSASIDVKPSFLQYLDGDEAFHKLDELWNPRNKHLADGRFRDDLTELSRNARWPINHVGVSVAGLLHWYANKANNKTWPVTVHDIDDTREYPRFRMCDFPTVKDVRVNLRGRTAHAVWTYSPGCVEETEADRFRVCWKVDLPAHLYIAYPRALTGFCRHLDGDVTGAEFTVPSVILGWRSVKLVSVEVRPDDIAYGGPIGSETVLGNRLLDRVFGGAYYPVQKLDLAVTR